MTSNKNVVIFIFALILLLNTSCSGDIKNCTWESIVEIEYMDNTKDTILDSYVARHYHTPYFNIINSSISLNKYACLELRVVRSSDSRLAINSYNVKTLACDIRSFKVLKLVKI